MRLAASLADIGDVIRKHRYRPENLAATDHFGNIRRSYDDNTKLNL